MDIYKISLNDANNFLTNLNCDKGGVKIMSKKTKVHTFLIKELHVGAANILKQDALSIGADLAVPEGVIVAKDKYVNALLIGSTKHIEILSRKELAQPFGLKDVAKVLNITQCQYSLYENGLRSMPIEKLIILAKYYDVSVDYILGLTNERKPYPKIK